MRNTFGNSIQVSLFGESHGPLIGAVIDGLSSGVELDLEFISSELKRRRPSGLTDTARREEDEFSIVSGVFNGKTTGAPICVIIPNLDVKSGDYEELKNLARPSHADFTSYVKYHGYEDYRGGGHFSGRVTAALVLVGAIMQTALKRVGVTVGTHILSLASVNDRNFKNFKKDIETLKQTPFPVLDEYVEKLMVEKVAAIRADGDSVGGVTQTAICGLPTGVGEPWFDTVEGVLSHALFSIGGIKGVEFGAGFNGVKNLLGSQFNDEFYVKNDKILTRTNNNGGVNGGISNGMEILFNCAIKPTPSISKKQKTVDFVNKKEVELTIEGRHDPSIVKRICPVIDAVSAICVCDMLAMKYGTDVFLNGELK